MQLTSRTARGTTLIETMIALTVLLIGMAGFISIQPVIVRANHYAKRVSAASMVATDLVENIHRWAYNDARLNASMTLTGCNTATMSGCFADATNVTPKWDMGKTLAGSYTPQFNDSNLGGTWQGLDADVDRDGVTEFFRYWNVFDINPSGLAPEDGKLVQVIVRWKEPNFGFRQVTSSTFRLNSAAAFKQ